MSAVPTPISPPAAISPSAGQNSAVAWVRMCMTTYSSAPSSLAESPTISMLTHRPQTGPVAISADLPRPDGFFARDDPTADDRFYGPIRMVTHIDEGAIDAVGRAVRRPGHRRVERRSSPGAGPDVVVGLPSARGAERARRARHERRRTRRPTRWRPSGSCTTSTDDPALPFPDDSFDAVLCCVSIDYLIRPVEVLAEAARVLRPGGAGGDHLLQPLLPDQGHPRLAAPPTTPATARSWSTTSGARVASTSPR